MEHTPTLLTPFGRELLFGQAPKCNVQEQLGSQVLHPIQQRCNLWSSEERSHINLLELKVAVFCTSDLCSQQDQCARTTPYRQQCIHKLQRGNTPKYCQTQTYRRVHREKHFYTCSSTSGAGEQTCGQIIKETPAIRNYTRRFCINVRSNGCGSICSTPQHAPPTLQLSSRPSSNSSRWSVSEMDSDLPLSLSPIQ